MNRVVKTELGVWDTLPRDVALIILENLRDPLDCAAFALAHPRYGAVALESLFAWRSLCVRVSIWLFELKSHVVWTLNDVRAIFKRLVDRVDDWEDPVSSIGPVLDLLNQLPFNRKYVFGCRVSENANKERFCYYVSIPKFESTYSPAPLLEYIRSSGEDRRGALVWKLHHTPKCGILGHREFEEGWGSHSVLLLDWENPNRQRWTSALQRVDDPHGTREADEGEEGEEGEEGDRRVHILRFNGMPEGIVVGEQVVPIKVVNIEWNYRECAQSLHERSVVVPFGAHPYTDRTNEEKVGYCAALFTCKGISRETPRNRCVNVVFDGPLNQRRWTDDRLVRLVQRDDGYQAFTNYGEERRQMRLRHLQEHSLSPCTGSESLDPSSMWITVVDTDLNNEALSVRCDPAGDWGGLWRPVLWIWHTYKGLLPCRCVKVISELVSHAHKMETPFGVVELKVSRGDVPRVVHLRDYCKRHSIGYNNPPTLEELVRTNDSPLSVETRYMLFGCLHQALGWHGDPPDWDRVIPQQLTDFRSALV